MITGPQGTWFNDGTPMYVIAPPVRSDPVPLFASEASYFSGFGVPARMMQSPPQRASATSFSQVTGTPASLIRNVSLGRLRLTGNGRTDERMV